ncbi:MAG: hypothetical protein R3298_08520 [Gammaproteobacteria bacterium]|nr:hypothetical protein [Gammaproteobacteria bacterium]
MKKLLAIAVIGLSMSGFAYADRASDVSWVQPTQGQPYDGTLLGRAGYPQPTPTTGGIGNIASEFDSMESALEANS